MNTADLSAINALKAAGYRGKVAVTANSDDDEKRLRGIGADEILAPLQDAADRAAEWLLENADFEAAPRRHVHG